MTFNPMSVMLGSGGKGPYVPKADPIVGRERPSGTGSSGIGGGIGMPNGPAPSPYQWGGNNGGGFTPPAPQASPSSASPAQAPSQNSVLGSTSVRATGAGPYDAAYRQDLATFAGGLFGGGNLSFNPTSNQPFGGAATGGGNAPVLGMPNTLLQNALMGNPFSFTPPTPAGNANSTTTPQMQQWLQQFMNQGQNQRMAGL